MAFRERPVCDGCGKPVRPGTGFLVVSYADIEAYEEKGHAFRPEGDRTVRIVRLADVPSLTKAPWRWGHAACTPDDYWIEEKRFDTVEKVLSLTLHLMEKRMGRTTNWPETVRRFHDVPQM